MVNTAACKLCERLLRSVDGVLFDELGDAVADAELQHSLGQHVVVVVAGGYVAIAPRYASRGWGQ